MWIAAFSAQARRLGHTLPNDIYSHVTEKINARLLRSLESRWKRSLADNGSL